MTTFLYNMLLTAGMTPGAERMANTDPNGFTLTLISVGVVFSALIILFFVYRLSGDIFSGKFKRAPKAKADEAVAAAIALALDMEQDGDTCAAIAAAVHLHLTETVHDAEPGIVTIRRRDTAWSNKALTFRKQR